jgi:hypothetical protein
MPVLDEQADSRAKRRLLMDALNIVVDAVSSAEDVGDGSVLDQRESDALFHRLMAVNALKKCTPEEEKESQRRFLAFAHAPDWNKIPRHRLAEIEKAMLDKERAAQVKEAV